MSRYSGDWAPYVPVAERRRRAALKMEKLRKKGHPVAPVVVQGRTIATTFWGKAWCDNLESYHDYQNRLPRGRTYVRNGSVVDLQIAPSEVTATVSGSSIYQVQVSISDVGTKQWASICKDCAGGIDSLVELLQGRFSKGVMARICRQGGGLFPKPAEIRFSCSCPDYASMCKHVAAVLYGVGARLDEQPELLFRLRAVDEKDLVARIDTALPLAKQEPTAGKVLDADNLSALFGLDMDAGERPVTAGDVAPDAQRTPVRAENPAQPDSSSLKRKATVQKSIRPPAQTRAGKKALIKRSAASAATQRKPVQPQPTVKAATTKAARNISIAPRSSRQR
jgi:uncharacterized Zn finger protein